MKTLILVLALISTPLYAGGYSSNGQFVADSAWTSIAEGLRGFQRNRDARESRRERKRNRRTRTSCSSKMQVNGMVSTDCTTR